MNEYLEKATDFAFSQLNEVGGDIEKLPLPLQTVVVIFTAQAQVSVMPELEKINDGTISSATTVLVEKMVICHENGDFETLKSLMDTSVLEDKDSFFTYDKFVEVSDRICSNLGKLKSLAYIGSLQKTSAIHTLWKATYTKSDEEILWQVLINGNEKHSQIIRMTVG